MTLKDKFTKEVYNIGFIDSKSDNDFVGNIRSDQKVRWIDWNGYKDGWFADPFILSADNETIEVLVEEWVDKLNRGRISRLTIDAPNYKLLKVSPIIEKDCHFSFPNILRLGDRVFVYPENYQSGGLYIYEYDDKINAFTRQCCLLKEPVLDAQMIEIEGMYYIFTIKQTDGRLQNNKLYIYRSDTLFGEYNLIQEIFNKKKEERGAGAIFKCGGKLIRPAQCCEGDYGVAVIFYQLSLSDGKFIEKEVGRIYPNKKKRFNRKIHTYNRLNDLVVVDGNEFKHRHIAKLYKIIKPLIG